MIAAPVIGIALDAQTSVMPPRLAVAIAAGETGDLPIVVYHADGATPYNLANCQLLLTVEAANPTLPPLISRQATIDTPSTGSADFPLLIGDTLSAEPGGYQGDVWLTDANFTPNKRFQVVGLGIFLVGSALGQPNQIVTVPPSQVPLGQGPPGNPNFVATLQVSAYTAKFNDLVRANPTGSAFTVTLPAASSALPGANALIVKNQSNSANAVTVAPAGSDTIDGSSSVLLYARELLFLFSDGISDWMVL